MNRLTYFVPVDFSDCSYNALQYATMLAGFSDGKVVLCHVIDLEAVSGSENQVMISWNIDRLEQKAKEKMKSLHEIISLGAISVDDRIVTGNVRTELIRQIEKVNPNVIVIGRSTERQPDKKSLVTYVTRNTRAPVLIVPGTHSPQFPNRALLATDMSPDKITEYEQFFEIIRKTSQQLSIVSTRSRFSGGDHAKEWVKKLNDVYGIKAEIFQQGEETMDGMVDLIRSSKVDLLCTVRRNNGMLDRFFERGDGYELASRVEVPVLVCNAIG